MNRECHLLQTIRIRPKYNKHHGVCWRKCSSTVSSKIEKGVPYTIQWLETETLVKSQVSVGSVHDPETVLVQYETEAIFRLMVKDLRNVSPLLKTRGWSVQSYF